LVIFLTIITQIGGILLIMSIPVFRLIDTKFENQTKRRILKPLLFIGLYLVVTFTLIPIIAKPFGRTPMPILNSSKLKPLNIFTCILNRHYVNPELLKSVNTASDGINLLHPGTVVAYLDANFPFIDKFPLLPHLSHNDGKKLDIAFLYMDNKTYKPISNDAPSFIGYGVYERPIQGELNIPLECEKKGFWQYSLLQYIVPQNNKDKMILDQERTKDLISIFVNDNSIGKIFIEPHLKARMKLNSDKVRFHGCQAVRHDDHIHIQLK
jgi:hypothetical protein